MNCLGLGKCIKYVLEYQEKNETLQKEEEHQK